MCRLGLFNKDRLSRIGTKTKTLFDPLGVCKEVEVKDNITYLKLGIKDRKPKVLRTKKDLSLEFSAKSPEYENILSSKSKSPDRRASEGDLKFKTKQKSIFASSMEIVTPKKVKGLNISRQGSGLSPIMSMSLNKSSCIVTDSNADNITLNGSDIKIYSKQKKGQDVSGAMNTPSTYNKNLMPFRDGVFLIREDEAEGNTISDIDQNESSVLKFNVVNEEDLSGSNNSGVKNTEMSDLKIYCDALMIKPEQRTHTNLQLPFTQKFNTIKTKDDDIIVSRFV